MRFVIAFVTLLLAAVLVASGVAQRTILKPPESVSTAFSVPSDAKYVVIPASVLRSHPGQQRLRLQGSGTVFAAYGRTSDVVAWLSGQRYSQLRVDAGGAPRAAETRTAPVVAGLSGGAAPDPDGADLWLAQDRGTGSLDWTVNLPASVSVLVASDGTSAAPSAVRLTWPLPKGAPLAVPAIVAGAVLAVVGLILYVLALVHMRRRRGPRRKAPPRMPKRPQPPRYRPAKPAATASTRGRRSVHHRSALRPAGAAALLLGGAVALTGCGAAAPAPAATAASTVTPASVAEEQASRIVHEVAEVAAKADAARSRTVLEQRFSGPALQLREAAYKIRAKDSKATLPQALPTRDVTLKLIVPERTTGWPRTLFTVVDGPEATVAPLALAMVQQDPRADYTVEYAMALQPKAVLPDLPSAVLGASRLSADAQVLRIEPDRVARAYGVLLRKPGASVAQIFDTSQDDLVGSVGAKAKAKAAKALGSTATIDFSTLDDPQDVVALSTADSGALVAANLEEQWTVKPKRAGVTVTPSGGTPILAKTKSTTKGIASVYGYQLLFSVPAAGSDRPVVLLGYAQGLVSAKEL